MKPYQLHIPTKVYFGRDIWREALQDLGGLLCGNVLVVTTGRSLLRLGYVDELEDTLQRLPSIKRVVRFDQVSANPRLSEVKAGIQLGRQEGVEQVVGFGGGSALDAAKAIAAGIGTGEDIASLFYSGKKPGKDTLPVIAMPTTAGTGSELSKAAILTDSERNVKAGIRGEALYPAVAVVDSFFTESVPLKTTMETGFDVLAHAWESYISQAASPYTRMQSEYAVGIVGKSLPHLAACLQDVNAREQMSLASMMMGVNLGNASTCLPHRLQYPLGAHTGTSHGAGLAALFPAWIGLAYRYSPGKIERLLELLTGETIHGADECAGRMRAFIRSLGLPVSLKQLGVGEELLDIAAKEVTGNIGNDPASQAENCVSALYHAAWQEVD